MPKYFCQDSFMCENKSFSFNICFSSNRSIYLYSNIKCIFKHKCMYVYKSAGKVYLTHDALYPANTQHLYNICTICGATSNVVQMLYKCFVFAGFKTKVNDGE